MILAAMIVLYGTFVLVVSCVMANRSRSMEMGKLSTYIVFIAWGSVIFGLCISRIAY